MRNLKKILAMVLALVMSLSLMATAGAANFTDASSINEKYETAIEVLEGLGVFKGYDENGSYSFKPTGEITRAETAAIIYRIVTGDVTDSQVGIYADYNLFTDVPSTSWYAGYVNFCANAEYIKGVGGGKFDPSSRVTGYAALAMILRAIGYTANGGFTGPDWEVQTARTAEARKITKNIMTGTLGQPATRETVAEILFQSILVNMVDHNVLASQNGNQGYTEIDETLGYKTFKLEQIEGVVVANEYADLYSGQVLSNGRTNLEVAEDDIRSLAITTEITDIGESRYAYITGSKVLAMGDTGNNTVTEFGHACDISTTSKFNEVAEMPAASDIEYYSNFQLTTEGDYYCDQRLEFSAVFYGRQAEESFDGYKGIDISEIAAADLDWTVEYLVSTDENGVETWRKAVNPATYNALTGTWSNVDYQLSTQYEVPGEANVDYNYSSWTYPVRYTKIIYAGENITDTDLTVLESIFGTADNRNNNVLLKNRITGDVFVGTKSTNNAATDEERDLSNSISYKKFFEDYIQGNAENLSWGVTLNGWWTKFIDNDGDGKCDYAFRTVSWLDEALYTYTNRNGDTVTEFFNFDDNTYDQVDTNRYTVRYLDGYTPALGDKVIAARIDNQILVEPAKDVTATVSAYSWRNDEITTDEGTYGQSGIGNATDMMELISTMDDGVEYVMYLDHFGYVRAYELPGGNTYALLTEMYYTNAQQGNLVDKWPMTAELTMPDAEGKAVTDEYNVVNGASTFTAKQPWMRVSNAVATYNYNNWLQPAIGALGVTLDPWAPEKGIPNFSVNDGSSDDFIQDNAYSTFWNSNRQLVRNIAINGMNGLEEFNYGAQTFNKLYKNIDKTDYNWSVNATASFTNVAVVSVDGENVSLFGAAQLNRDKQGNVVAAQPYAVNYIQLSTADADAQAVRYPIYDTGTYAADNNYYVNAVHDTQYFIAYNGGVYYAKDFVNFPGLTMEDNVIHAAYAVARNTNSDVSGTPYWVADVIVYEVYSLADLEEQTSVSLAYYTPNRLSGTVQQLETLNSKYGPEVTLTPGGKKWESTNGQWGVTWGWDNAYGFYRLYNDTEPVDNVMTASSIKRVDLGEYGENRIYAGWIEREAYLSGNGYYIDVNMGNGKIASIEVTDKIYSITQHGTLTTSGYYNEATPLRYADSNNKQVLKGDLVIWINDGAVKASTVASTGTLNSTKFVVDLGGLSSLNRVYAGVALLADTPDWLVDKSYNSATDTWTIGNYGAGDGITKANGEWQKIMNGQVVPGAPTYDYDVTVNCIDAAGNIIKTLPVYGVNKNGSVFIKTTDITLDGYTLGAVTNVTTDTVIGASTVDGVAGYLITGIDKDMTVTAAQTKTALTVALTTADTIDSLKVNDVAVAPVPTTGDTTSVVIGDRFEYQVSGLNNKTNEYELTSTPTAFADDVTVTWNAAGTVATIKGTMGGDSVALTLTDKGTRATTTITVVDGGCTVAFDNIDPNTGNAVVSNGAVYQGEDVTFTVTVPNATTGIDKVTYTVGAGTPVAIEADGDGVYTVPGTAVAAMPITITVTTISTAPFTVTFTNNATPDVFMTQVASPSAADWDAVPASIEVAHNYDGTISIESMAPITVTAAPSANATVSAPTDYQHYTISNITGNVTITLADTGTASGLSATFNADGTVAFTGGAVSGTTFMTYLTTGTSAVTTSVKVGMTVAEAETALSTDTGETVALTEVTAPGLTLTSAANTHYLVIVEINASNRVVKAGAVAVSGIS